MFEAKGFGLQLASQFGCQRNYADLILCKTKAAQFFSLVLIIHNVPKIIKEKSTPQCIEFDLLILLPIDFISEWQSLQPVFI